MRRFAFILLALVAVAQAQETESTWLTNTTLSCSVKLPSTTLGCFWERPVWVSDALGLELAIAVDAQASLRGESYVSPMFTLAWYGPRASVWLEAAVPDGLLPITGIGRGDWVRFGVTYRFP